VSRDGEIARTERLKLRAWTLEDEDVKAGLRLWGDSEVMAKIVGAPLKGEAEVRAALSSAERTLREHGVQIWAVEELSSGAVVGACGFRFFAEGPILELSFQFVPPVWGRGYACEAGQAAVADAFGRLGATKLIAGTLGEHPAAQRVIQKLGFKDCGTMVWPDNDQEDPYFELLAPPQDAS